MEINHVLVVEDDKEIREGVKIYLTVWKGLRSLKKRRSILRL